MECHLNHVRHGAESVLVFVGTARFVDEMRLRWLATKGVQIGPANDVGMDLGRRGPMAVPNQLIIPVPAQRFDDIQPRFAAGQTGGLARSRRPGRQGRRHGGRWAFFVERCRRFTEVVNDFLVQMVIGTRQLAAGQRLVRCRCCCCWRRLRSGQLPPAAASHPRRSSRSWSGRRDHPAGLGWNNRGCYNCWNLFFLTLLLLLLLALKVFDDFQHASSHS